MRKEWMVAGIGIMFLIVVGLWGMAQRTNRLQAEGRLEVADSIADAAIARADSTNDERVQDSTRLAGEISASRNESDSLRRMVAAALSGQRAANARADSAAVAVDDAIREASEIAGDSVGVRARLAILVRSLEAERTGRQEAARIADARIRDLENALVSSDNALQRQIEMTTIELNGRLAEIEAKEALQVQVAEFENARPGWAERLWEKIDAPVAFAVGVAVTLLVVN